MSNEGHIQTEILQKVNNKDFNYFIEKRVVIILSTKKP